MDKILLCILLSDAVGTLLYIIWKIYEKEDNRNSSQAYVTTLYTSLHLVVIIFFTSMIVFAAAVVYIWSVPHTDSVLILTPRLLWIYSIIFIAWMAGALCQATKYLFIYLEHDRMIRSLFSADSDMQDMMNQLKSSIGIRSRRIRLYTGYSLSTPEMTGIFNPRLCYPVADFQKDELKCIMYHELFHYKYKDELVRNIGILLMCIHWFNPKIREIVYSLERWDELHCDICVCEKTAFSEYGQAILTSYKHILGNKAGNHSMSLISISLYDKECDMIERFQRIMGYNSDIKQKRKATAYMALILLLAAAGTALAAEPLVRCISRKAYTLTACDVEITADTYTDAAAECVMYEEVLDEETLALINGGISTYAAPKDTFNFTITDNTWTSGAYWAYLNQTITISAIIDPSDVEIKVGVVDPSGVYHYVKGTDVVTCVYPVEKNGFHQVFIKNETTNTVSVYGSYVTKTTE